MKIHTRWFRTALLSGMVLATMSVPASAQKATKSPQPSKIKNDIPAITRKALPAVGLIVLLDSTGNKIGQGSGFVASPDGKVVTNYHVIQGAAAAVIKFPNGAFFDIDGILAIDQDRDIAILKASGKDFSFLTLGDSKNIQVGEQVLAIGSPLSLEATVSNGIVSAVRELREGKLRVLQTTAPISPGSSGGPLLNLRGEVIGITAFHLVSGENLNFAISSNYIAPLLVSNAVTPFEPTTRQTESPQPEIEQAESPPNIPRKWKDVRTGDLWYIRVDGDYLYAESDIDWTSYGLLGRYRHTQTCDTKGHGDKWEGKCYFKLIWENYSFGNEGNCTIELDVIVSSISPHRIEGEIQSWENSPGSAPASSVCGTPSKTRSHFILMPED